MMPISNNSQVRNKNFPNEEKNIPTLGTKHSHVGNEIFPRMGINDSMHLSNSSFSERAYLLWRNAVDQRDSFEVRVVEGEKQITFVIG